MFAFTENRPPVGGDTIGDMDNGNRDTVEYLPGFAVGKDSGIPTVDKNFQITQRRPLLGTGVRPVVNPSID